MAIQPLANEKALLADVAKGEERAFSELFKGYGRPLGAFVLKITQSPELTEEIVQDAFVKIWMQRERLAEIENFSAYLFILCRNHTFAALKKLASERLKAIEIESGLLEEMDMEGLDNPAEALRERIEQAVSRLPEQQQRVYRMSRYQRMKHEEIAAELGISQQTVKKHIQLALQFIRREAGDKGNIGAVVILTTSLMLR
ncbi:RNA polymerase sigma-70 factor [Pedobacter paludis]|uniref:RNA polymerase subunit sigma-24 n=1 Tax=Pedobacter paludis TaxID=2203212 RepID=A0A317F752_9SPHI|nr:RNA polymerase sigma-70 factor [Pedobacter paludis]PWS33376.1 RNA polymerase subunit sigma-24 [Pedobacter paludis]